MLRARYIAALLLSGCCTFAEQPSRISHEISGNQTFTLKGNVRGVTATAQDVGEVNSSLPVTGISIRFKLSAPQQADMNQLLQNLQDRTNPQYHKFLTPAQYADRFGLSTKDMAKVVSWLEREGFTDVQPSPTRSSVRISGSAGQVANAFQVSLHRYQVNGIEHFANANDPVLPKELNGLVEGIRGLTNLLPHPRLVAHPHFTSSISNLHFIVPDDFATIYDLHTLYNGGINGTGISIAVAGQTDIANSDIDAFRAASGLPANDPTVVMATTTDPGTSSGDLGEADLDIELSGAVARNASIIYVNSNNGAFDALQYAIENDLAPVASISYGDCESDLGSAEIQSLESVLQQGNAEGITVLAASGDDGAADCDYGNNNNPPTVATHGLAVDYPASSAYVTGVGGTEFTDCTNPSGSETGNPCYGATQYWSATNNSSNGSALSYIPETAWNDTSNAEAGGISASGGGVSSYISKPSWQTGPGVPADGMRDVPDIALTASPVVDSILICSAGWCTNGYRDSAGDLDATGGTSIGPPSMAGVVALLNQKEGNRVGNINPNLYQLAAATSGVFHDITTGNNIVPCTVGTQNCTTGSLGYSAAAGYDQVTGLGSMDMTQLVNGWPDFLVSLSTTSVSIAAGASSSVTVNVTRTPYYSNSVTFTCTTSSSALTCTAPGSVANAGSGQLTITRASSAAILQPPTMGWQWPAGLMGAGLFLLAMRRQKRQLTWAGATCLLAAAASCGGGSSATVAQTVTPTPTSATVTLTATTGSLPENFTINATLP